MMLSDVCLMSVYLSDVCLSVCLSRTSGLSREQTKKTKIGREVANVSRDADTTFKVKRSKVKVTKPLCSPPCWRIRRLQRWAWERTGRGKLLIRCRLQARRSAWRREALRRQRREERGGAYRGDRPPTACYI